MRPRLVVMVKEPRPGRVKTRLARDIGSIDAAWWYRRQCARLLTRLDDPRWALTLAVSPDAAGLASRVWPRHLPRIPQGPGDLGQRMRRCLSLGPPGPVLLIGSDIPGVAAGHIADGFRALAAHAAAIGPAPDGGYWAIGLARRAAPPPRLFEGVRWSTEHALSDTLPTLGTADVVRLATLADVDTAADL